MDNTLISQVLNIVLSVGFITALATLRYTRKRAAAEAKQAEAAYMQAILENNQKYVVEPLKKEINALRKTVNNLTRAINRVSDCPHAIDCPVRSELQKQPDCEQ